MGGFSTLKNDVLSKAHNFNGFLNHLKNQSEFGRKPVYLDDKSLTIEEFFDSHEKKIQGMRLGKDFNSDVKEF